MAIAVGIAGASGYTGVELLRLLTAHPEVEVVALAAGRAAGASLGEIWPGWQGRLDLPVEALDAASLAERCDAVFLGLPHGVSAGVAPTLLDAGVTVVDLGADFRLRDADVYTATYGEHPCPERLADAVYAMPELHRDALAGAKLLACPGCYPTATTIASLPLVEAGLADLVIADCMSGVSGAGRKAGSRNLYCEVQESVVAYGLAGTHRHTPELEQTLGVPVVFTPHLVPMIRGMVATVKVRPTRPVTAEELRALYRDRYADHPAVVVVDAAPASRDLRGTCAAHVHVTHDPRRDVITAVAAIDNLGKGAAGQAVHAFNLAMGLPETTGLPLVPVLP